MFKFRNVRSRVCIRTSNLSRKRDCYWNSERLPGILGYCSDYITCWKIRIYSNIYPTRCNITQFILSGNCSTCFGWYNHPLSGAQTTVSTASGICHTVTATCRYSLCHPQHTQTGPSSSTIADSSNGVTDTRCCRHICLRC